MELNFNDFLHQVLDNPLLLLATVLTLGVILVNGWTYAPNAIATCVVTRCMSARSAILMAAVFNFLGVFVMSLINSSVAETITKMVDFGDNSREAVIALSAALFAIVIWATLAWVFGIPTSESHALIAGLTGGALALHNSLEGVNGAEWVKVLYGIVISVILGFGLGWLVCKGVVLLFRRVERRLTEKFFRGAQIFGAASMSFMHGAQDGQKFMGVILLSMFLANGEPPREVNLPIELMLICSIVMGVGAVKRLSAVNFSVVKDMAMTWILTFPGCGLVGFLMTKLFMWLFL